MHIANALKAQLQAIQTALVNYNSAVANLNPPHPSLSWEEVIEYVFLSDFDLLRDTQQDICKKPWAMPAGCLAMDSYFKLLQAKEEIIHLNVEIPCLATYMRNEEAYLQVKKEEIWVANPALSHQIQVHRMEKSCYIEHHMTVLNTITSLKGYTSGALFGIWAKATTTPLPTSSSAASASGVVAPIIEEATVETEHDEDLKEEQVVEDEEMAILGAYYNVFELSLDTTQS